MESGLLYHTQILSPQYYTFYTFHPPPFPFYLSVLLLISIDLSNIISHFPLNVFFPSFLFNLIFSKSFPVHIHCKALSQVFSFATPSHILFNSLNKFHFLNFHYSINPYLNTRKFTSPFTKNVSVKCTHITENIFIKVKQIFYRAIHIK